MYLDSISFQSGGKVKHLYTSTFLRRSETNEFPGRSCLFPVHSPYPFHFSRVHSSNFIMSTLSMLFTSKLFIISTSILFTSVFFLLFTSTRMIFILFSPPHSPSGCGASGKKSRFKVPITTSHWHVSPNRSKLFPWLFHFCSPTAAPPPPPVWPMSLTFRNLRQRDASGRASGPKVPSPPPCPNPLPLSALVS